MQQPSGNLDDSGYFSVQVIIKALALYNLELIPLNSTDGVAVSIRQNATKAQAYIFNMERYCLCALIVAYIVSQIVSLISSVHFVIYWKNCFFFHSHWYCIRRFKCEASPNNEPYAYFNLDSLLGQPEYMSSSFLTEYLKQMQNEGYSIFIVSGEFPEPECAAEPLRYVPMSMRPPQPTQFIDLTKSESKASVLENDEDIQRAIQLSLSEYANKYDRFMPNELKATSSSGASTSTADSNSDLDAALKLSLECFNGTTGQELNATTKPETLTQNQLRDKRLAYFSAMSSNDK